MIIQKSFVYFLLCFFIHSTVAQNNAEYDSLLIIIGNQSPDTSKVINLGRLYELTRTNNINLAKKFLDDQVFLAKQLNFAKGLGSSYYNLGVYYKNIGDRDSTKYYLEKSIKIFQKIEDTGRLTSAHKQLAINEYYEGNYVDALDQLNKVIAQRILLKDSSNLAADYDLKSGIYRQLGNIDLALQNVLKAIKIHEKIGNNLGKALSLQVLAALEGDDGNEDKAQAYNLEALSIYEEEGDKFYAALANNNVGTGFIRTGDFKKAKQYLEKAISLATELNAVDIIGDSKTKLGSTYMELESYDKALIFLKEALSIHDKNNQSIAKMVNLSKIAQVYNRTERASLALPFIDECIEIGKATKTRSVGKDAYSIRSETYRLLKNYKKALEDLAKSQEVRDSLYKEEKLEQIERLKTEFEVERKEKELIIEKSKVVLLEKEAALSRLQKLLLLLGLGLSIIIAGLGYYGFRQKMQRSKIEKEKLDAELEFKKKKLTSLALQLAQKNERLIGLKSEAQKLREAENTQRGYQQLINSIDMDLNSEHYWQNFSKSFEEVHHGFNSKAMQKYPDITANELRLMSLIKMNLSSKEIANMLNISIPGVKKARQRLRKKMNLNTSDSLQAAVLQV